MNNTYDLEKVYDERISPLMAKVIAICMEEGLPMISSFGYAYTEDGPDGETYQHCTTVLPLRGDPLRTYSKCREVIYDGAETVPRFVTMTVAKDTQE